MLKIDTHRHLGGCITSEFVWDIVQDFNLKHLGESFDDINRQMTFAPSEQYNFHRFLDKFKILDDRLSIENSTRRLLERLSRGGPRSSRYRPLLVECSLHVY